MEPRPDQSPLTDDDIAALSRLAGLPVPPERLPHLRAEIEATLSADHDMDAAVRRASVAGGEPFDPAWNEPGKGGSR